MIVKRIGVEYSHNNTNNKWRNLTPPPIEAYIQKMQNPKAGNGWADRDW